MGHGDMVFNLAVMGGKMETDSGKVVFKRLEKNWTSIL